MDQMFRQPHHHTATLSESVDEWQGDSCRCAPRRVRPCRCAAARTARPPAAAAGSSCQAPWSQAPPPGRRSAQLSLGLPEWASLWAVPLLALAEWAPL